MNQKVSIDDNVNVCWSIRANDGFVEIWSIHSGCWPCSLNYAAQLLNNFILIYFTKFILLSFNFILLSYSVETNSFRSTKKFE